MASAENAMCFSSAYRKDLDVFFVRWQRQVNSKELRNCYTHLLKEAAHDQLKYWLLDVRSRGLVATEDEDWLLQVFFPQAEKRLGGPAYYAYLLTPDYRQAVAGRYQEKYGSAEQYHHSPLTTLRLFYAEADALKWLKICQQLNQAA